MLIIIWLRSSSFTLYFSSVVQSSSYEQITIPFSGEVGFLEHVVVQISTTFQGVDVQDYLDNDVYYNLYYDLIVNLTYDYFDNVMPNRGDILIELTSPQGTTSILLPYRILDSWPGEYYQWPFMSVHFWGEDPTGDWTLTVRNRGLSGILEVSDVQFAFYGTTSTPQVISRIPEQCDEACARGCAAAGPEFCDSCRQLRNATTLECIEDCPEGFTIRSGYCYDPSEPEPVCTPREFKVESDAAVYLSGINPLLAVITVVMVALLTA